MPRNVLTIALVALALLAAPLAGAATAEESTTCSVPCGYIYPLIIIEPEDSQDLRTLPEDGSKVEVPATLTWTFDITQEGFTVNNPTEPIEITFEFPRKPSWAGMEVEPEKFEVPITPQYIEPEADDPSNPSAQYVYQKDITVRMWQKNQATLAPGDDAADLLVFAKSSESGLYKPSYGIKEFTVDPEGAVVEARDTGGVDAAEVPRFPLPDATRGLGPVDVELQGADSASVFEPTPVTAQVTGPDGPVPSTVSLSLVDESGTLLYATGPRDVRQGGLATNLTFPEPGTYRVLVTASPADGADVTWTPGTVAFPVDVGGTDEDAVQLPNQYTARYHEVVSEVHADPGDPASQYEKFIPLPVYGGANGANLLFELGTDNPAAAAPSGPANLNVDLLGPSGGVVAKGTFDPANPTLRMPVNALPGDGLYQIHVYGQGGEVEPLAGAAYDVQASVTYDGPPVVEDVRDGDLDAPGTASHGGIAIETAHDHHAPWTPVELTVPVTAADGSGAVDAEAAVTVLTPDGERVVSTGWQPVEEGAVDVPVTFPGPGAHQAAVHVRTPQGNGTHVQPTTLASTLHVGGHDAATVTLPDTYRLSQAVAVAPGTGPEDPHHRTFPVTLRDGAAGLQASLQAEEALGASYRLAVTAPDGSTVGEASTASGTAEVTADDPTPGRYQVTVEAEAPEGGGYQLDVEAPHPGGVTVENPLVAGAASDEAATSAGEDGGNLTPASPLVGLAALAAAGAALARRRD